MIMLSLFLTLLLQFAQALPRGRGGGGRGGSSAGGGAAGKFWRIFFLKILYCKYNINT